MSSQSASKPTVAPDADVGPAPLNRSDAPLLILAFVALALLAGLAYATRGLVYGRGVVSLAQRKPLAPATGAQ